MVSDPEKKVVVQDIGSLGGLVSSQLQLPGELGNFSARTRKDW